MTIIYEALHATAFSSKLLLRMKRRPVGALHAVNPN
jgi:hypothetical protein